MLGGVFICHSSTDAALARRVVEILEADGTGCWIAPRDIAPGESWTGAILAGLSAAPALILLFSEAANESPHVAREVERAVSKRIRVIPIRLEDAWPSDVLDYMIHTTHWLDAVSLPAVEWEATLVETLRSLLPQRTAKKRSAKPKTHVVPTPVTKSVPAKKSTPPTKASGTRETSAHMPVRTGEDPWRQAELREVLDELNAQREHSLAVIEAQVSESSMAAREGEDATSQDQADGGGPTQIDDHELRILTNERDRLRQLDGALARIGDGSYGICESCGAPIGKMRLMAFPRATLCMTCKQREEAR